VGLSQIFFPSYWITPQIHYGSYPNLVWPNLIEKPERETMRSTFANSF
jgi:hypothetical protein